MNKIGELLKQAPVFLNEWNEKIDVLGDFEDIYMTGKEYKADSAPYANEKLWEEKKIKMAEAINKYEKANILFASYGQGNYEGDAFVLFVEDDRLFEVNGGHCSCYGLEGQWEPEETTVEAVVDRLVNGHLGEEEYVGNAFAAELKVFLGV